MADRVRIALALAGKDLRLYFRDRAGMALGFLLPIALVTVMGFVMQAMAGGDGGMPPQKLRVADLDRSEASRAFTAALASSTLQLVPGRSGVPWTREQLVAGVSKGDFALALVIEPEFERRLLAGERPLELLCDPSKQVEMQMLLPSLLGAFARSGAGRRGPLAPLFEQFRPPDEAAAAGDGAAPPAALAPKQLLASAGLRLNEIGGGAVQEQKRNRLGFVSQAVSGTAAMMLLFGLTACGASLLRERDEGTLRRLLLSPAPRTAILWGKFLFTFVIGLLQLAVMFAWGMLVFDLPVLDRLPGIALVSVALAAACTGFGILIATLARTQKQVDGISTLVILLMSALGGSWFPRMFMPEWMQTVGSFTVNAWAMDGYQKVFWYDLPVLELWPQVGMLLLIAAILSAVAAVVFTGRNSPQQT